MQQYASVIFITALTELKSLWKNISNDNTHTLDNAVYVKGLSLQWRTILIFRGVSAILHVCRYHKLGISKGLKTVIVLFICAQFAYKCTKQHVKPYNYCFCSFRRQFRLVFGMNKSVQQIFTLWSTSVQVDWTSNLNIPGL